MNYRPLELPELSPMDNQPSVAKEEEIGDLSNQSPSIDFEEIFSTSKNVLKEMDDDVEQEEGEIIDDDNAHHDDAVSMDVEDEEGFEEDGVATDGRDSGSDIAQTEQAIMDEWAPVVGGSFFSQ